MYTVHMIISRLFFISFPNQSANRTKLSINQLFNTFISTSNKHCKYNNVNVKKGGSRSVHFLMPHLCTFFKIFHLEN